MLNNSNTEQTHKYNTRKKSNLARTLEDNKQSHILYSKLESTNEIPQSIKTHKSCSIPNTQIKTDIEYHKEQTQNVLNINKSMFENEFIDNSIGSTKTKCKV